MTKQISVEHMAQLSSYQGMSKVRMTALKMLVGMMDKGDVEPLRNSFLEIDRDRTGFITVEELSQALLESQIELTEEQVHQIVKEVDIHGNGKINYTEFITASLNIKQFMTEEKLREIFRHFDEDDTNYISKENLRGAMAKMGERLTEEEID